MNGPGPHRNADLEQTEQRQLISAQEFPHLRIFAPVPALLAR